MLPVFSLNKQAKAGEKEKEKGRRAGQWGAGAAAAAWLE